MGFGLVLGAGNQNMTKKRASEQGFYKRGCRFGVLGEDLRFFFGWHNACSGGVFEIFFSIPSIFFLWGLYCFFCNRPAGQKAAPQELLEAKG